MSDQECTDPRCTRVDGRCMGMHCTRCGEPCGSQGHRCATRPMPLGPDGPIFGQPIIDDRSHACGPFCPCTHAEPEAAMSCPPGAGRYRSVDFDTPPYTPGRSR